MRFTLSSDLRNSVRVSFQETKAPPFSRNFQKRKAALVSASLSLLLNPRLRGNGHYRDNCILVKFQKTAVVVQFGVGRTDCAFTEPWPKIGY